MQTLPTSICVLWPYLDFVSFEFEEMQKERTLWSTHNAPQRKDEKTSHWRARPSPRSPCSSSLCPWIASLSALPACGTAAQWHRKPRKCGLASVVAGQGKFRKKTILQMLECSRSFEIFTSKSPLQPCLSWWRGLASAHRVPIIKHPFGTQRIPRPRPTDQWQGRRTELVGQV